MNQRQRVIITKLISIIVVTVLLVIGIVLYKDIVIRNEAIRAMNIMAKEIATYKDTVGSFPPSLYLDRIRDEKGLVRIGHFNYRARWVEFDSDKDTILAYSELKFSNPLVKPGFAYLTIKDIEECEKIIKLEKELETLKSKLKGLSEQTKTAVEIEEQITDINKKRDSLHKKKEDGSCKWLPSDVFERILQKQQSEAEVEILLKSQQNQL